MPKATKAREPKSASSRWIKGQSGNPGGRPKAIPEVGEMCRALLPEGVKRLGRLMLKSKDQGIAVAAFKALADRGLGKPLQQIDAKVSIFDRMTADEQRSVLGALNVIAGDKGAAAR